MPVGDLYHVEDHSRVNLECLGSGNLHWTSSNHLEIPQDMLGDVYQFYDVYQSYDHTRDALALVIQNFTSISVGTYACMTNLTDSLGAPISLPLFITNGELINDRTLDYCLL